VNLCVYTQRLEPYPFSYPPYSVEAWPCISFIIFTHFNSYHVGFHSCLDRWIGFGQCTDPIAQYYHFHSTHFFNLSTCYNQLVRWIMYVHFPEQLLPPWSLRQLISSTIQGVHLPERLD